MKKSGILFIFLILTSNLVGCGLPQHPSDEKPVVCGGKCMLPTLPLEAESTLGFSQDTEEGKDLEVLGFHIEETNLKGISDHLILSYGLSEERAQKVARLANSYQKIVSKRSLTETELNKFGQDLLGMNYKMAKSALEKYFQGDDSAYESLLRSASEKNGIGPEEVTAILGEILLKK